MKQDIAHHLLFILLNLIIICTSVAPLLGISNNEIDGGTVLLTPNVTLTSGSTPNPYQFIIPFPLYLNAATSQQALHL